MKTDYDATDDILVLHFTDKPVSREVSQDWNLNIAMPMTEALWRSSYWMPKRPTLGLYRSTRHKFYRHALG